jgi:hypothetical protein
MDCLGLVNQDDRVRAACGLDRLFQFSQSPKMYLERREVLLLPPVPQAADFLFRGFFGPLTHHPGLVLARGLFHDIPIVMEPIYPTRLQLHDRRIHLLRGRRKPGPQGGVEGRIGEGGNREREMHGVELECRAIAYR